MCAYSTSTSVSDGETLVAFKVALANERFDEAYGIVRPIYERNPSNKVALKAMIAVELARGSTDSAVELASSAVQNDPDDADASFILGNVQMKNSNPQEALKAFNRTAVLLPTHATTFLNLGEAYKAIGKQGEAHASFVKAVELAPTYAPAYNNLAVSFGHMHPPHASDAISAYRSAIELLPSQYQSHFNLGSGLAHQKAYSEASHHIKEAIAHAARNPHFKSRAYLKLAEISQSQGHWGDSHRYYHISWMLRRGVPLNVYADSRKWWTDPIVPRAPFDDRHIVEVDCLKSSLTLRPCATGPCVLGRCRTTLLCTSWCTMRTRSHTSWRRVCCPPR